MDSGNMAWMLTASALVLFMTPGLAFFYGGLVRAKNIVNTIIFESSNFTISVLIGVIISTLYCFKGGFKAIINTDRYQFYFMFSGFLLMVIYIIFFYDYMMKLLFLSCIPEHHHIQTITIIFFMILL